MRKLLLFLVLPAVVVIGALAVWLPDDADAVERTVAVRRGTVTLDAVASGRIEPRFEVPVTSNRGGVLTRRFVELGQKVAQGEPLVEVRPVLTDFDRLQAERTVLGAREAELDVNELRYGENAMGWMLRWLRGGDALERMRQAASRARTDAEQQQRLLLEGQTEVEGKILDFLVRAPIDGHVIELSGEVGQPVVPASAYGAGSDLLVLADMDRLVFRGTVQEIDAGRLHEGMSATLDVGALPGAQVVGELREISLRSRRENNATVFDVKVEVNPAPGVLLRSGYSAVARIEVARAEDALILPERAVTYRGDRVLVRVRSEGGGWAEREIGVGLSDGLTVVVREGLAEAEEVLDAAW